MKLLVCMLFLICFFWASPVPVLAHQPRIISDSETVEVNNPEVSQAFYATLQGEPHVYEINTPNEILLYTGVLVPKLPHIRRDIKVEGFAVHEDGTETSLFFLDGMKHKWEKYYEPFAGDHYYEGPDIEITVPLGSYRIEVSNPENTGKYVLTIGKEETFSPAEAVHTIRSLPTLKRDFFKKSPLTAYFNLVGLFMLIGIILFTAALGGIFYLIKSLHKQ